MQYMEKRLLPQHLYFSNKFPCVVVLIIHLSGFRHPKHTGF